MAREKELFRDNLERLDKVFPNKEILKQNEVAAYLGLEADTVRKYYWDKKLRGISKVKLASLLS